MSRISAWGNDAWPPMLLLGPGRGDGQALRAREGERLTNLALGGAGPLRRPACDPGSGVVDGAATLAQPAGRCLTHHGNDRGPGHGRAWTEQSFTASGGAE